MKIHLYFFVNDDNFEEINNRIRDFKKTIKNKYNIDGEHYLEIL